MSVNWDSQKFVVSNCYECLKKPRKKPVFGKIDERWLMFCSEKCFCKTVKKIIKVKESKNDIS